MFLFENVLSNEQKEQGSNYTKPLIAWWEQRRGIILNTRFKISQALKLSISLFWTNFVQQLQVDLFLIIFLSLVKTTKQMFKKALSRHYLTQKLIIHVLHLLSSSLII